MHKFKYSDLVFRLDKISGYIEELEKFIESIDKIFTDSEIGRKYLSDASKNVKKHDDAIDAYTYTIAISNMLEDLNKYKSINSLTNDYIVLENDNNRLRFENEELRSDINDLLSYMDNRKERMINNGY